MSDLCERLQDINEAGFYRLNCAPAALRVNAELADFCWLEADLSGKQGKGEFLAAVAKSIQAPDWFGHNFDALADAFGDLSWLAEKPPKGYVLLLRNAGESFGMSALEYEISMEIFKEAARYWQSQGKAFWVFYTEK